MRLLAADFAVVVLTLVLGCFTRQRSAPPDDVISKALPPGLVRASHSTRSAAMARASGSGEKLRGLACCAKDMSTQSRTPQAALAHSARRHQTRRLVAV